MEKVLDKEKIITFICAFMVGIIAHILIITSNIAVQDSLWLGFAYSKPGDWEISLGRWGILLAGRLNNFVMIPSVVTILGLIAISIAAVLICDIFCFKKKISKLITIFAIIISPSIYITFFYIHTALAYCMAFLFSTLSIWFLYKLKNKKIGFALCVLFFTLTLSLYQSYIGVMVGICIMYNLILLLKNSNIMEVLKSIGIAAVAAFIGAILYYCITTIIFNILSITLSSYMGANNIGFLNIITHLGETICESYKSFWNYYFKDNLFYNTNYRRDLLWWAFFVILLGCYICKMIKNVKDNKEHARVYIALNVALMIFIPLGLNIINLIVGHSAMYALTTTQMILIVPFAIAIIEEVFEKDYIYYLEVVIIGFIIITFFVAGNASYESMRLTYYQSITTTERIISRIETLDEYEDGMPVVFAGIIDDENFKRLSTLYNYSFGTAANNSTFHGDYSGQVNTWIRFLEVFFGIKYPVVSDEWYKVIVDSKEFKDMDIFPRKDSVKVVEGAVVVKLKENPARP